MTADELGTYMFDLMSEAAHVFETIWIKETDEGPVLVVGLRDGSIHHIAVTTPQSD